MRRETEKKESERERGKCTWPECLAERDWGRESERESKRASDRQEEKRAERARTNEKQRRVE